MIKKTIKGALITSLLLMTLMTGTAFADSADTDTGFFVYTKACPDSYIQHAQEIFMDHLAFTEKGNDSQYIEDISLVELGTPFSMANKEIDMFVFPVYHDGEIIYQLRVAKTEDGEFITTMSEEFVGQFNELASLTTPDSPMLYYNENDSLFARISDQTVLIFGTDSPTASASAASANLADSSLNDLFDPEELSVVNTEDAIEVDKILIQPFVPSGEIYLGIDRKEYQDSTTAWCGAVTGAQLVRYSNGITNVNNMNSKHVMDYTFGAGNYTKTTQLTTSQITSFGKSQGLSPVTYKGALSDDIMKANIANGYTPVIMVLKNVSASNRHGIICRGYGSNKWSVWNPLFSSYETMSGSSYLSPTGKQYNWVETIHGWW